MEKVKLLRTGIEHEDERIGASQIILDLSKVRIRLIDSGFSALVPCETYSDKYGHDPHRMLCLFDIQHDLEIGCLNVLM